MPLCPADERPPATEVIDVTQSSPDRKPAVRVAVVPGNLAVIDGAALPALGPLLSVRVINLEQGGPRGHRRVEYEAPLFDLDSEGRMLVPAGLLPRCLAE